MRQYDKFVPKRDLVIKIVIKLHILTEEREYVCFSGAQVVDFVLRVFGE